MKSSSEIEHELRNVILQLELCSHVSAVNLDPSSRDSGEDIGGKRPPGGIDRKEDAQRDNDRVLRSAEHYKRRMSKARTERGYKAILVDAECSLAAWKRQPPAREEPEFGSSQWKRYIGESKESYGTLASRFGCHRSYIQQIRRKYAEAA